jgi:hypothetical protein
VGRTTLNPNQINPDGLSEEERLVVQPLKAIDPFGAVELFNDKGLVTPDGLTQFINAAENTTIALNTIHLDLHQPELQAAIKELAEKTVDPNSPESRLLVFVNVVHAILHEIDRAKK